MKIYNKFVESKKEPSNKNDIWFDGSVVKLYEAGEWYTVTLSKEALEKLVKYAENVKIFKYVDTLPEIGDPSLIYFQKELSDGGIILVPYVYDDEWKQITNSEVFTETSPFGFGDAENSAVLKGDNNQVISEGGVALGKDNLVGLKGFYYKHIRFVNTTLANIYLSKTQVIPTITTGGEIKDITINPADYYLKGDTISIVNDNKYNDIAVINNMSKGMIQIKWLYEAPFSSIKTETNLSPEDYSIYCLDRPINGISDLGKYSFANGTDNKAINTYTEVSGKGNVAKGKFGKVWGKDNIGGYNTTTFGSGNVNLADNSLVNGTNNINEGNNSVIHGNKNKNYGKRAFVVGNENITNNENEAAFGKYNNSENDTQFSIGIGTSDTDRKNAFEVKQNGDIYIEGFEKPIQQELTNISERTEENEILIEDLQNTKIDKEADDYYPQLSVGLADNLAGVDVVDSEINFRRSGGGAISDGVARIEAIKGNSVVWNQLFDKSKLGAGQSENGLTITTDLENATIKIVGNATESTTYYGPDKNTQVISGHKYLLTGCPQGGSYTTYRLGFYKANAMNLFDFGEGAIATATATDIIDFLYPQIFLVGTDVNLTFKPRLYDLTQMFGAGNEPTTIEEFNARKPLGIDENAYNDGEVIHMDAQSLESVGVNQWDEEWESGTIVGSNGALVDDSTKIRTKNLIRVLPNKEYHFTQPSQLPIRVFLYGADKAYKAYEYITSSSFLIPSDVHYIKVVFEYTTYNHDICINLSDASINGKYFPYIKRTQSLDVIGKYFPEGIKSAGTAHDEIRYNKATQKWEKVVRIGSVDMGSLLWSIDGRGRFQSTSMLGAISPVLSEAYANVLTNEYVVDTATNTYDRINDKVIAVSSDGYLKVVDSTYTDAAPFKAAMQGVVLYYELAEPIVTEIEDDFNLDYEVWNGGTENIVSDVPTAPLKADIAYGFNAVGKIKELEEKINSGGGGGVSKEYVDGKLTELSAEVSGLSERIDNLPSAESDVFKAIYGVTTFEEIKAAYDSGKVVHCDYKTYCYVLSRILDVAAYFDAMSAPNSYRITCGTDGWTENTYQLELNTNKVTTLSESSTDNQYPSAKAVYDFVSNTLGTIINGDY